MKHHIVVGGLHIESTTFTSYTSGEKDFFIKRGKELLESYPWISDFNEIAKFTPLIYARALPGGIVSKGFFDKWFAEFKEKLLIAKNEGIDGVLLDIHGAMTVEGIEDAEGYIAREIRKIVGTEVLISTTMDLHGNVSDLLFESTNLITCYRTAPHIDSQETRKRAFYNLILVLKEKRTDLVRAKVDVPILLPGEKTSTEKYPGKNLYNQIEEICLDNDILDCSIWMGFPWADQERSRASIVVVGFHEEKVSKIAKSLGEYFWNLRNDFEFVGPVGDVEESVKQSLNYDKGLFFISDTGDNPGAGGSGDLNIILRSFLNHNKRKFIKKKVLFASIFDTETIGFVYQNDINKSVEILLGGKTDSNFGNPLKVKVVIKHFFYNEIGGRSAIVSVDNIYIIVTEKRIQYGKYSLFKNAGINDLNDFDIIVVKMGYLEPDLSKLAQGWIMALSPGAVNQDLQNITYENLKRPLFPFDNDNFNPKFKPYIIKK